METKNAIRERVGKLRDEIESGLRQRLSSEIQRLLVRQQEYVNAGVVCCYLSMGSEVETQAFVREVIAEGEKTVVVPIIGKDKKLYLSRLEDMADLTRGEYGFLEPTNGKIALVPANDIDLFVVPGIAFDRNGNRIGRGAGHYDRFLEGIDKPKIGLAYYGQIVDQIPAGLHDVKMDKVVTNLGVITCGKNS